MLDVGHVLYGSQNYNLAGPDSDKDYKVLLCPEAEDFYFYKKVEKNDTPKELSRENYSPMDVRKFDELVRAGNPNCLEMLWSKEYENLYLDLNAYMDDARYLFESGYLVTVFPKFFGAVKGLVFNSLGRYGLNRKSASRALFWGTFVERVVHNNFVVLSKFWDCEAARRLRFSEELELPTLKDFEHNFEVLEKWFIPRAEEAYLALSDVELEFFKHQAAELKNTMKKFVFGNLRKELVDNHY